MQLHIYSDESYKKWFDKQTRVQYMCDCRIDKYESGVIVNEKSWLGFYGTGCIPGDDEI